MNWSEKTIGFALTGSHCMIADVLPQIARLVQTGARVVPIVSETLQTTSTRFGTSDQWQDELKALTGHDMIKTIVDAEPLGPTRLLDVLVIAPCTGNTLSKLASAQTESAVLMAAKAQMRNGRPMVIALSTNDGLGLNQFNIAKLMIMKHTFFVPFGQDAPLQKPNSLVARMELIVETCAAALQGVQLQPLIIERFAYST
ncbi:MAG: dipicolinate synthase subunit B [Paenibacillaceae bacterium]|jgi:dipicolinate synthase subunit B|nr:dipicolinate synthase subunit B [Paenibacillaceae bacterium]